MNTSTCTWLALLQPFLPAAAQLLVPVSQKPHRRVWRIHTADGDYALKQTVSPLHVVEIWVYEQFQHQLPLVPILASGQVSGQHWFLQPWLGTPVPSGLAAPFVSDFLQRLHQASTDALWPFEQIAWHDWVRRPLTLCEHWPELYAFSEQPFLFERLFDALLQALPALPDTVSGWSHGDLKPENLLCDADGRLFVNDWHECRPGDPLWDLAKYSLYIAPEAQQELLTRYLSHFSATDSAQLKRRFRGYVCSWAASQLLRYRDLELWEPYQARLDWTKIWLRSSCL